MKINVTEKVLENSQFRERKSFIRRGWDVGRRPEPEPIRERLMIRWRLRRFFFILAFASQKGNLFALCS